MNKKITKLLFTLSFFGLSGCSLQREKTLNNSVISKITSEVTSTPTISPMPSSTPIPTSTPKPLPTTTPSTIPTTTPLPTPTPLPVSTPTPASIPKNKVITLTFDDGPTKYTPQLLELLKQYNIKATFFVLDYKVKSNPDFVKQAYLDGHEICTHGYSHASFLDIGPDKTKQEIIKSSNTLLDLKIDFTTAVRPPYGHYNSDIKNAVKSVGEQQDIEYDLDGNEIITTTDNLIYPIIMWSCDSRDWENKDPEIMTNIVLKEVNKIGDGCIILFHDTTQTTIDGVAKTIPLLLEQGYTFETLTNAFDNYNTIIEDGKVYYKTK